MANRTSKRWWKAEQQRKTEAKHAEDQARQHRLNGFKPALPP